MGTDASPPAAQSNLQLAVFAMAGLLGSCAQPDESAGVMAAVLKALTADGRTVCADSSTSGEPLAIFRTMMRAPDPSRRPLAWQTPTPLRPEQSIPLENLVDDEFRDRQTLLRLPVAINQATLPQAEQGRLNAAAWRLALLESDGRARFRGGEAVPKARTRWWVINRIDRGCRPVYTASRPVVSGNIAFVSVLAGHWGTTYAVEKRGKSWVTTAKWSDWLY